MTGVDFTSAQIVPEIPATFDGDHGRTFPANLIGAEIVAIGTLPGDGSLNLAIDYRTARSRNLCRVVLAFNDVVMWVAHQGRGRTLST